LLRWKKAKDKNSARICAVLLLCFFVSVYSFLTLSRISQAIAVLAVSWAFCENCLSVCCELTCMDALMSWAQEAQERGFHSMVLATQQWGPRAFYGAPGVATAFFGYFFWLQKKSTSP
jgi:hypothetical protein